MTSDNRTPPRPRNRTTRRGFTLMEALVTIVVLVMVLPAIIQGFNIASKIAIRTRQRAEATALAQSTMDELVSTGEWQDGSYSSEETHRQTTYTVEATLVNWEEADSQQLTNLQRMDVTVTWTFENAQDQIVLSTVVYSADTTIEPISNTATVGGQP